MQEKNRKVKKKVVVWYPNGVIGTSVILINGLEPTNIIVGVRNEMDIDLIRDDCL